MEEAPIQKVQIEGVGKPALFSKTMGFNLSSGILIPAVWPFLPKHFRDQDYAIAAVTAWFTILNMVLRWLTKEAITSFVRKK